MEEIETAIKVVVVGNGAVGKSSMIQRFCKGVFTSEYKKTIGVDFLERQIKVKGEDIRLMLWDTAGQEEFDAITKAYYRGAQVCVLTFSTVDRDSFEAIERWKEKVEAEVSDVVMAIVQNKMDLIDESVVTQEEVEELAKRLKLKLFRTSVKEDFNVNEVFNYLSESYLEKQSQSSYNAKPSQSSIGMFNGAANGSSHHHNANGSKANNTKANTTGETFQIKPMKQRTNKKHSLCILL